jgi:hypothetical protein
MGKVPELLSARPWMRRMGSLIVSAFMDGNMVKNLVENNLINRHEEEYY